MGMPNSKFVVKEVPKDDLQEGSIPSTPIMTPRIVKLSEMDPRSPSLNIARTPLEILSAAAEKLELLDKKTPGKAELLLGIDPRSPTMDFKRTPIFVSAAENDFPRQLHNKNIEKVRKLNLLSSPKASLDKYSPKTPKLLESSPIKARTSAYKRRSLAGLLETNIDYTETDLDTILQGKYQTEQIINKESDCVSEIEATSQKHNVDCTSETEAAEATEKQSEDEDEANKNEDKEIVESIKELLDLLEQEEVDIVEFKPSEMQIANIPDQSHLEILENCDTDSIPDNPNQTRSAPASPPSNAPLSPILPEIEIKSAPVTPPVNLTADVKELDKKLTNLIYEEDLVVCPRIIKLKDQAERSPLRSCGNEPRAKSAQKLKVSDKPRRSDYAVSKIPVFKEKGKGKLVQCENTPPRNMDKKVRQKKSDWDTKDITLYL